MNQTLEEPAYQPTTLDHVGNLMNTVYPHGGTYQEIRDPITHRLTATLREFWNTEQTKKLQVKVTFVVDEKIAVAQGERYGVASFLWFREIPMTPDKQKETNNS